MARRGENIYRRKDGRYEGRYVIGKTAKGKTRFGYVYARQFSEARRLLLEKKAEQQRKTGHPAGARRITVAKWMRTWMESELLGSVKPSSYQVYLRQFERHVLPALGGYALSELTPGIVHGFVVRLESSDLARSTAKGIYRLLAAAMRSAQEEGLILKNPCRKIRVQREERAAQRALSRQEQEALCAQPEGQADLPTLLSLYTGMRLGEICGLKWTDVDWERQTIAVRRTAQRVARLDPTGGGRTMLMVGSTKSLRSERVLPAPAFLLERLKERRSESNSEYIFGVSNRAAEPRTLQRRFRRQMERLGITGVHFHTLRHSFATRMLELGGRRQDGERAVGAPLGKDDAGLLCPRPDRPAALRHGAAHRLLGRRLSRQAP